MAAIAAVRPLELPSVKDKVSPEEWEVRVDLAALYRLVAKDEMTDLAATHISARVPGPEDHFLINPYGLMFEEITASSLVKVDMNGEKVMDTDFPVNPAGFTIHSAVHMARPEVGCVAHTHTVAGMALSCLEEGLLPMSQTALMFYNRIGYHDWEGIATNLDERERLVRDLGPHYACILRNHGLLACGRTVTHAWTVLYYLEKSAQSQLAAMAAAHGAGTKVALPTPEVAEHTARQFDDFSEGLAGSRRDWPTFLAELDRKDPSYRN